MLNRISSLGPLSNNSPQGIVTNGLLLWLDAGRPGSYPGSGTTWYDLANAVATNDATLVNSPTYSTNSGGYLTFAKASNQSVTVSGTNLVPSAAYTKAIWFNLTDVTSDHNLISGATGGHFMFFSGTNKLYSGHANWVGYTQYSSTATFSADVWYHVVLTYTSTDGMKLYINGEFDSAYTANKTAHAGDGSTNIGRFGAGNFLNGSVAHVLTYNRAITELEVKQNFNAQRSRYGV